MRYHFEIELTNTIKALNFIDDSYRTYEDDGTISWEASNYFVVTDNEEVAESIAFDFGEHEIQFTSQQDCEECGGEGHQEKMDCHVGSASLCCGGCVVDVDCEECEDGKVDTLW